MLSKFRLFTFVRRSIYCTIRADLHVPYPRKPKLKEVDLDEEPVMRVLNVAEKNDAAKNIAKFLARGSARMVSYLFIYSFSLI